MLVLTIPLKKACKNQIPESWYCATMGTERKQNYFENAMREGEGKITGIEDYISPQA